MNEQMKFLNQSQPQTLFIATLLLYVNAAFGLLFGTISTSFFLMILTIIGLAAGGFGIANEKKWGYAVGVAAAIVQVMMLLIVLGMEVIEFPFIITLMFDGALVALLLHPESRDYQRIWFK